MAGFLRSFLGTGCSLQCKRAGTATTPRRSMLVDMALVVGRRARLGRQYLLQAELGFSSHPSTKEQSASIVRCL